MCTRDSKDDGSKERSSDDVYPWLKSASKLWNSVACQSSVAVPVLPFHHETLYRDRSIDLDRVFRCLHCQIKLQLSHFLIVGFKLTYALVLLCQKHTNSGVKYDT